MAHEITATDTVVLRKQRAWHGLGTIIEDDMSAVEAARSYGLTWPVEKWSLTACGPNGEQVPVISHWATVRVDATHGNLPLGVVGPDYVPCQNLELAQWVDALAQTGKVCIETCGSLRGGKNVWFLARGESFAIGGVDTVVPYLCCSNSHDGLYSIRLDPTTIRVVCANTHAMVVPSLAREACQWERAAIKLRHTGSLTGKLEAARNALRHYEAICAHNREQYEALAERPVDRAEAVRQFSGVYAEHWQAATDDELRSSDPRVRKTAERRYERMERAVAAFLMRYDYERRALGLAETQWAVTNAITGWLQHDRRYPGRDDAERVERKMHANLFGLNRDRTNAVFAAGLSA